MRSQTHQPPHQQCQHGRGEVNLTIIGELWGIIKVHWLQRTPAAGQSRSQDVRPPGPTTWKNRSICATTECTFILHTPKSNLKRPGLRTSQTISSLTLCFSMPRRCNAIFCPKHSDSARPTPFFQLSHICKANEMFCSEKKEGAGGWFWRSGEKWGDRGGMRQGEPGPWWTTKGPVSQRQLLAGGEGSQERPWLGPGPARSTRTGSTLTALGRKQHAAAAPSHHRGQDWITNYTSTQLVYLRLDRKDRHTLSSVAYICPTRDTHTRESSCA